MIKNILKKYIVLEAVLAVGLIVGFLNAYFLLPRTTVNDNYFDLTLNTKECIESGGEYAIKLDDDDSILYEVCNMSTRYYIDNANDVVN